MATAFWNWLTALPSGAAGFLGTLAGSTLGLLALILGALFNASLNRKRDDRIRNEEALSIRAALKAELSGIYDTLLRNAASLDMPEGAFVVPDVSHSIRIMPALLSKMSLLEASTIRAVLDAYVSLDQYCEGMLMLGGSISEKNRDDRVLILMPKESAAAVAETNRTLAALLKPVMDRL